MKREEIKREQTNLLKNYLLPSRHYLKKNIKKEE